MSKFPKAAVTLIEDYEPTGEFGRKAEPNEYTDDVTALVATWSGELKRSKGAVKLVVPTGSSRTYVMQKFSKAARAAGYTARFDDKANETIDDVSYGVMVAYLVPIINRTRKSKTLVVTQLPKPETSSTEEGSKDGEVAA